VSSPSPKTSRHPLVWLVALPLLLLAIIGASTPVTERAQGFDSDGKRYAVMADASLFKARYSHEAPWCWRVMTPFLASLLPFSTLTDFRVLAVVSNWLSLVLIFGILRRNGFSHALSALGVVLYAGVFWSIKFFFYSPAYIDSGTQVFWLAILYCAVTGRYAAVPVLLTVGVLQKESLLLLAPVVWVDFAARQGSLQLRSLAYGGALAVPAALILLGVRTAIPATNDYAASDMIASQIAYTATPANWPRLLLAVFSGLGILPFVAALRPRAAGARLHEPLWFALLVLGGVLLVAGEDKARLFLYALPAVVVLAVAAIDDLLRRVAPGRFVPWLAVTLGLHLYLGHHLSRMVGFRAYMDRMVPTYASDDAVVSGLVRLAVVTALFAVATALLIRPGSPDRPSPGHHPRGPLDSCLETAKTRGVE
jgi:hypothetical protein